MTLTPGSPLVIALVLAGAVLLITLMVLHANRIERRAVAAAHRLLPNHAIDKKGSGHRFTGRVNGVEVSLRLFQNLNEGESGGLWTEVLLPPAPGISLELRPQDAIEAHRVKSGLAKDAQVGDPAFDKEFIVEMAPASLAPAVFDAELRRRLIELDPVKVLPGEGGGFRLVKRHWEEERFAALIETGALLARSLQQAAGAEAAEAERWGASHVAERAAEQAELEKVRAVRTASKIRNVAFIVVGMLVILVVRSLLQ